MTYSSEVLADSPSSSYRLGETSGTVASDSSGNGRNGAYIGTFTLGATGLLTGDSDTALSLAGSGGATVTYDSAWLSSLTFSAEAWFKPTSVSGTQTVFSRYAAAGFSGSRWTIRLDNSDLTLYTFNGTSYNNITIATGLTTGVRHHVVFTFDGSSAAYVVYLDGSLAISGVSPMNSVNSDLFIGHSHATEYFNGIIDEVAYYPTVLSSTRVAAHYTAGTTISNPSGTISATLPKPTASLSGTYAAPTGPTGNLAAVLPFPTVDFTGTYLPHPTGSFAVTLPKPTVSIAGAYTAPPHPTGSFAAVLPKPTVALSGTYAGPVLTDLSNAFDGLDLVGTATATITRPPAPVPPSLVPAEKYDKAVPYPVPVMVNGRPT